MKNAKVKIYKMHRNMRKKEYIEMFVVKIQRPHPRYVYAQREYIKDKYGLRGVFEIITWCDPELKSLLAGVTFEKTNAKGETETYGFSKIWLNDINIKTANRLVNLPYNGVFDPSKQLTNVGHEVVFNVFQGYNPLIRTNWRHTPEFWKEKGLPQPTLDSMVAPCLGLMRALAEGDTPDAAMRERCFVFLRNLIACKIQYPQRKLGICIIFESLQGVGKNVFWDAVGRILGSEQYMCTSKAEDVLGKHAEAIGKLLIVMNECEVGSKKEYEGLLKSRITETKLRVNPKHARPYDVEDFSIIVALTNKSNPLPVDISSMDRRFISWECGLTYRKKSSKWWGKFVDYLNQPETIAALYEYFNNIDISGYDFKAERKKVLTKSYQRLATVNIPCEAMILAELCKMYAHGRSVGESTLGVKPLPESNSEAYRICENDTSLTVEEVKAFFEENGVSRWCEPVDCYLKSQRGRQFNTVEEAKSKLMEGWVCHIMRSDVEIKKSEV
jgi:hypothetical protein